MGIVEQLAAARTAYERREWTAAFAGLDAVDSSTLDAVDLQRLATAAHLLGKEDDSLRAMQSAYQSHLAEGRPLAAARCAFWLSMTLVSIGRPAVAAGWVGRLQRIVEDHGESVERGYLSILQMFRHIGASEFAEAHACAVRVTEHGRRFGESDLLAMGLSSEGRLLTHSGHVRDGLALYDEAMVSIAAGEISPMFAGMIYCSMIESCQEVSDLRRAADWTAALTRWCEDQPGLVPFTGQCAVHRGQIMSAHGAFSSALEEFARARDRYALAGATPAMGLAWAEEGDVLRVLGDLTGAEAAYERATEHGYEPQPGLALLWLARGRTPAAVAAVRRLLAETDDPVQRSRLLPAAVEVLLAAGEVAESSRLAVELSALAVSFGCAALSARAAYAEAAVLLSQGDAAGALPYLRRAATQWAGLDVPYESARCRRLIGGALTQLGDVDSARAELTAALRSFTDLGARLAEQETAQLLTPSLPGGLTEREVEVLRLVAAGRSNPEIAQALVLSEKTVARHLSNIFGKIDVTSRTAAAAYAFENRLL